VNPSTTPVKVNITVRQSEERVISTYSNPLARVILRPQLPDQNITRLNELTGESLDSSPLGVGIATISAGTLTLFMSHNHSLSNLCRQWIVPTMDMPIGYPNLSCSVSAL